MSLGNRSRWIVPPVLAASLVFGLALFIGSVGGVPAATASASVSVSVRDNQLVNANGQTVRLLGVDRSGTEYACEQGWGIFDGPSTAASVADMVKWHVNAVRLPLNEGCWLDTYTTANDPYDAGRNPAPYEGATYRGAIGAYVSLLHSYGIAVILTLMGLDAPGGLEVPPMADSTYSPAFWASVASYFKSDPGVLFDAYNEPNAIEWPCWLNGCSVTTAYGTYQTSGMQVLVTAIRSAGATQPIMLGGLAYSSDESSWLTYEPTDPDRSLVVSFHTYASDHGGCNTVTCWDETIEPLAKVVPVVTGEFGEYDCGTSYSDKYMAFADGLGISYLGWAWDAISPGSWSCASPSLIKNYNGKPSHEGSALHSHLTHLYKRKLLPPAL
jgi:hypothetical protein